ncbi:MAG: hypothetical protein PHQ11_14920 [Paludibacter sp.]|jgi:gas vesicle protein|nr:hypothetical protein [Paludibacter sp.]
MDESAIIKLQKLKIIAESYKAEIQKEYEKITTIHNEAQGKVNMYDIRDSLTDRQSDLLDKYTEEVDSCEMDMENLESIIENIDDLIESLTESIYG